MHILVTYNVYRQVSSKQGYNYYDPPGCILQKPTCFQVEGQWTKVKKLQIMTVKCLNATHRIVNHVRGMQAGTMNIASRWSHLNEARLPGPLGDVTYLNIVGNKIWHVFLLAGTNACILNIHLMLKPLKTLFNIEEDPLIFFRTLMSALNDDVQMDQ